MSTDALGTWTTRRGARAMRARVFTAASICCALFVTACGQAPHKGAGDQVPDVNEFLTRQKDARWAQYEWPTVDNAMRLGATGFFAAPAPTSGPGGCAVGLAQDGQILYLGAYGQASPGRAWELHTHAPVGSVAKTLTAIAAMRLTARTSPSGAPYLQLFEYVGEHLSTSSSALFLTPIVTLLDHTSGAGGTTPGTPPWIGDVQPCLDLNDPTACPWLSRELIQPRLAFPWYEANLTAGIVPQGIYSNVGYSVLGAVIDRITTDAPGLRAAERGYEPFVWHAVGTWTNNILDSRRMLSLALVHSWRVDDGDFQSYARGMPNEAWSGLGVEGWEGPSGGWTMTIGDLTRFAMLFGDNAFLAEDLRAPMTQARSSPLAGSNYGLGVMLSTDSPARTRWWHGGVIGSHHALWAHWPNINGRSYAVALQCNNGANVWNVLQPAAVWLLNQALLQPGDRPRLQAARASLTDDRRVHGAVYELNFDAASAAQPANLLLPLAMLDPGRPALSVAVDTRTLRLGLTLSQRGGAPRQMLVARTDDGTAFRSTRFDLSLGSAQRRVVVSDATLEFGFSADTRQLAGMTLSGVVDARQFAGLPFLSPWDDVCRAVADLAGDDEAAGGACEPCADGEQACLAITVQDITGHRVR
jgi:CubicO group peptidase (beta-lactamase class C family)